MMGVFVQLNEESKRSDCQPIGYVIQESGCWEWTGSKTRKGYGKWFLDGRCRQVHRVMYERARGPIPVGLTLDHLCRNRACVNPGHMEPVTNRENVLRGMGHTAVNAHKTHCKNGHLLVPATSISGPSSPRPCRTCAATKRPRGLAP